MNQNQRAKWERTREKGMWRFVLLWGVLYFGGLLIVVTSIFNMITGTFAARNLSITVPIHLIGGFVFGLTMWLIAEFKYKKTSQL